jgi:hypothetical protein
MHRASELHNGGAIVAAAELWNGTFSATKSSFGQPLIYFFTFSSHPITFIQSVYACSLLRAT